MKNVLYTLLMICFTVTSYAQSSFEAEVKAISKEIGMITAEEKEKLRQKVESINLKLEKKEITTEEANMQKIKVSEIFAERIELRIEPLEERLQALVQEHADASALESAMAAEMHAVEMEAEAEAAEAHEEHEEHESPEAVEEAEAHREHRGSVEDETWEMDHDIENEHEDDDDKIINLDDVKFKWDFKKHKKRKSEHRTTTQFVFSIGLNNIISDGDLSTIEDNGIKLSNSRFYEWGLTWKTRLAANSALLQLKYGLSFTYNNLRPENNFYYIKNGNQTVLAEHPEELRDEPYFRRINMVVPVHLEFDFSKKKIKDDQVIIRSQRSFRMGIGGYAGINLRTKQVLEYKSDGLVTDQTTRGDYNTGDLIYGASAYVGYKDISIYTKFDLNPLFTDNPTEQKNISLGLRFDFN
ncbi:MAG: hypothetical protein H7X99_09195 [Saprospiraceae bacterium]|nr:hypothetical protein [Saprospiraceae bacterium]